ncbi:MAG: S1 RNA-binding domain-containing protein, partial [bacterium]
HPSEALTKGTEVKVVVLSVDVNKERLSLGIKQLSKDPWDAIASRYAVGDDIEAEVTKITNFGVFAAPEEELEGLVHISEISTEKVSKPEDIVRVGDIYKMRVLKIEPEQRKLGLSIRAFVESTGEDALIKRAPEPEPVSESPEPVSDPDEAEAESAGAVAETAAEPEPEGAPEAEETVERPET